MRPWIPRFRVGWPVLLGWLVGVACGHDPVKVDPSHYPKVKPPAKIAGDQPPIRVKVLVLEFNPLIPPEVHAPGDAQAKPLRISELCKFPKPLDLAAGYMQDVCDASGGFIQYEIVEWLDTRVFHKKADGFVYTAQEWWDCWNKKKKWHEPDFADYPGTFEHYKIVPRVESGEIDEVWFFGAPYFGYNESAMAGQGAFYVNGEVFDKVPCKRAFVIMGFNYERGVAEMTHDLCHRTEDSVKRAYGGKWELKKPVTTWDKFTANDKQSDGVAACGTCHWPPNSEHDYDYANKRVVQSDADDWLTYPKLTGAKKPVNCETWGGPDYHRNYMKWWFSHLPKVPGVAPDGRQGNWWKYIFDFNRYDEQGQLRKGESQ